MGGFITSPTDTLNAHAALLSIELKIEYVMTQLPEHPLHNLIRKSMETPGQETQKSVAYAHEHLRN